MKAQTDTDADAMEQRFPCYIHGMLKMETSAASFARSNEGKVVFSVPAERRIEQTRLEVRYSPTLAGAMVDALPYMVDFPYGCTEQTLNRFVPTVITQKILRDMKIDLAEVEKHQTNLNAQEIGDDKERMKQWKRFKRNPVFTWPSRANDASRRRCAGPNADQRRRLGLVLGLGRTELAAHDSDRCPRPASGQANGVKLPQGLLERGETWLRNYQDEQVRRLHNYASKTIPYRQYADNIDALVYMVLVDANVQHDDMRDFLYRDRTHISVYGKAMFGLALHKNQQADKLAMTWRTSASSPSRTPRTKPPI